MYSQEPTTLVNTVYYNNLKEKHFVFSYVKQKCIISLFLFEQKQATIEYYGNIMNLENAKRDLNVKIDRTCAKGL